MKKGTLVLLLVVFFYLGVNALFAQSGDATVTLGKGDSAVSISVSKIAKGASGMPEVTIKSGAISGAISMSAADMLPFVACALLEDGTIVDPILLSGGVEGGSGYTLTPQPTKPFAKDSSSKPSGGVWKLSGGKSGYLHYAFDTAKSIKAILVGTYEDYAKSNYSAFVKAEVAYTP
jgi:hypothetical protein